jgi:hypothetical protein
MENNEEQFLKIDDEILFLSQFVPGALAEGACQFFFKEIKISQRIIVQQYSHSFNQNFQTIICH